MIAASRPASLILTFAALASLTAPPCAADEEWELAGPLAYNPRTDLTWQRCAVGQSFDGANACRGEAVRLSFDEALTTGRDGWRMPTLDELRSLVVPGRVPTIDGEVFPDTPVAYFWSTDGRDETVSWYVYFGNGQSNHYFPPRTNRDLLRLVRQGRALP